MDYNPELSGEEYGEEVDIWSMGVVLLEISIGMSIFGVIVV